MHENAKKKITGQITVSLKQYVIAGNWPEYQSFEKYVDAISSEVLKHKGDWLDRSDVYSIFYDLVSEGVEAKASSNSTSILSWWSES